MLTKPIPQPKAKPDPHKRMRTHRNRMEAFRDAVWKRDGLDIGEIVSAFCYVCRRYLERGNLNTPAEVHHAKSRGAHPETKYNPAVGVILCLCCHQAATDHRIEVKR